MSNIEWTGETWNPIVGCTVESPGCKNCYAMKMAWRHQNNPSIDLYDGTVKKVNGKPVWTGQINEASERQWNKPLRHKKPTTYFVNSMGDLFHPNVPTERIDRVFAIMALCPQHTFQILTKHPKRMREYVSNTGLPTKLCEIAFSITCCALVNDPKSKIGACVTVMGDIPHLKTWPLPNVWLGVSVEDQPRADLRIPELLDTPAAVRFVSYEPALGPVDFTKMYGVRFDALYGVNNRTIKLDWIIMGGESGPGARPMHPEWARSVRDQCAAAGVPFYFKQWGDWVPWEPDTQPPFFNSQAGDYVDGHIAPWLDDDGEELVYDPLCTKWDWADGHGNVFYQRVGKKAAGHLLDGVEHRETPK